MSSLASTSPVAASTRRLLIDTDAGVDDAVAIILALRSPVLVSVTALTCVNGNTSLSNVASNVLKCCQYASPGAPPPVYLGASAGLSGEVPDASYFHGRDGLGDAGLPPPPQATLDLLDENIDAVQAMIKAASEVSAAVIE